MAKDFSTNEDYLWIQDVLAGNEDTYKYLVQKYRSRIFKLVFRFTRNDHDLDDLCQDVFIRAYQKLSHYRGEAPFEHWLLRIATNCCYSWLRKNYRSKAEVPMDEIPELIDNASAARLSRERARELIEMAFTKMSVEERLVITLLELEDKSIREIASLTGWSESNVKTRAHRARHALATILRKEDDKF